MTRLRVLSFRGIRSRYIYYLLDHLKEGEDVVDMEHNQVQLAEYFGVTRPALSKEIGKLVDSNFISISRGKVKILNKQALISLLWISYYIYSFLAETNNIVHLPLFSETKRDGKSIDH